MVKAGKVKRGYLTISASASSLVQQVKDKAAGWGWAHNQENLGKLEAALSSINDFGKRFMLEELSGPKREIKHDRLLQEFERVLQLSAPVEGARKCTQSLLRMHKGKIV